jgi:hypothetical protein
MVLLIIDLRIKNEKFNKLFQTKDVKQNNQLNDKLVTLDRVKQNILDKKSEIEFYNKRITELTLKINSLENIV